jgi:Ran GTPase-activating protein (RanGAP) involved in mRNA processing and transport
MVSVYWQDLFVSCVSTTVHRIFGQLVRALLGQGRREDVFWIGWDYCRSVVGMGGHDDIDDDDDNNEGEEEEEEEEEEKGEKRLGLLSAKPKS